MEQKYINFIVFTCVICSWLLWCEVTPSGRESLSYCVFSVRGRHAEQFCPRADVPVLRLVGDRAAPPAVPMVEKVPHHAAAGAYPETRAQRRVPG